MTVTNIEHVSAVLGSPIDERHIKQRKQKTKNGEIALDYVPWAVLCRCLHHRVPGWSWRLLEVKEVGSLIVVVGRLTIPADDTELTYDAVASEPLDGPGAPAVETAASGCLRRAAALANLGLDLWL